MDKKLNEEMAGIITAQNEVIEKLIAQIEADNNTPSDPIDDLADVADTISEAADEIANGVLADVAQYDLGSLAVLHEVIAVLEQAVAEAYGIDGDEIA